VQVKRFAALMRGFAAQRAAPADGIPLSARELYAAASDANVILEANSGVVIDANPAASALLGVPRAILVGARLGALLELDAASRLAAASRAAVASGRAEPFPAQTVDLTRELEVVVSSVRAEARDYLLVHLAAGLRGSAVATATAFELITQAAEPFIVTDPAFVITYCNPAFARLARGPSPAQARGAPLTRWIALRPALQERLIGQMAAREAVTVTASVFMDSNGVEHPIELHAVAVPDGAAPCFGFWIRRPSPP
jgi:PAS domain-containing protein